MKKTIRVFILSVCMLNATGQPTSDTSATLVVQKENIITASTIIKIENLGFNINSDLAELRPTISADGNLLFFICENHHYNTKYIP
jgi:hypothetical protein